MKNKKSAFIFGLLAVLLVFSMVLAGCPDSSSSSGFGDDNPIKVAIPDEMIGTWTYSGLTLYISGDTAVLSGTGTGGISGMNGSGEVFFLISSSTESGTNTYYFGDDSKYICWNTSENTLGTISGLGFFSSGTAGVDGFFFTKQ